MRKKRITNLGTYFETSKIFHQKAFGEHLQRKRSSSMTAPFLYVGYIVITPCGARDVGDGHHDHRARCGHRVVHVAYALALPNPLA